MSENISEITIRPIIKEDIEIIRNWRNKEGIRNAFLHNKVISSTEQELWYRKYQHNETDLMFIVHFQSNPIGAAALYNININDKSAEFGRLMVGASDARGKGFGKKITECVVEYGFFKCGLDRIYLEVYDDNIPAKNIYLQIGFQMYGQYKHQERLVLKMQMMANDYK